MRPPSFHGIERCSEPCRLVRCLPFRKRRRHPMGSIYTLDVWIAGLAKAERMTVLRPGDVNSLARQEGTRREQESAHRAKIRNAVPNFFKFAPATRSRYGTCPRRHRSTWGDGAIRFPPVRRQL